MKKDSKKEVKKSYYDVKIEAMVPAVLTYRVLAESAEEAFALVKSKSPNNILYSLTKKKNLIVKIYDAGSVILKFMRKV